jgi:hypothetical protein
MSIQGMSIASNPTTLTIGPASSGGTSVTPDVFWQLAFQNLAEGQYGIWSFILSYLQSIWGTTIGAGMTRNLGGGTASGNSSWTQA